MNAKEFIAHSAPIEAEPFTNYFELEQVERLMEAYHRHRVEEVKSQINDEPIDIWLGAKWAVRKLLDQLKAET